MKNKELYHKTVDLLLDAYNNNELFHGSCFACAVGNIIKFNLGREVSNWGLAFCTTEIAEKPVINYKTYKFDPFVKKQIDCTGYTIEELAEIEFAFESSIHKTKGGYNFWTSSPNQKQGQFIGLTAVLNVLKEIHETKEDVAAESQVRLEKIYNLVSC